MSFIKEFTHAIDNSLRHGRKMSDMKQLKKTTKKMCTMQYARDKITFVQSSGLDNKSNLSCYLFLKSYFTLCVSGKKRLQNMMLHKINHGL